METMRIVIVLAMLVACGGEYRPARDTYNEGVASLGGGDLEAAEKQLIEARSAAGFRAAYNLGVAYAQHAQQARAGNGTEGSGDLAKALELAQQSMSWFSDAARLRKDDPATQANLSIMRARVQALTDELRKAEGTLEARLDAVIADQRGVLDEARVAWFAIKQTGGSDPLAQQGVLVKLADRERGVVSEVGVVTDLAADEIDAIAKKPDDKRDDKEKVRVVQLKAVDLYLQDARARIAEARRKLQDLAAEDGVARAEAALVALKRAREQLLDPITVLRGIAQDELQLLRETTLAGSVERLDDAPKGPLPGWLSPPQLAERQGGLRDRIDEVKARLLAAVTEDPDKPAPQPQDPKVKKTLDRVRAAMPAVTSASDAMKHARESLVAAKLTVAIDHERTALEALAKAIEQFSDLKQTIELAYQEERQITRLLGPEAAKELDATERGKQTKDGIARNTDRVTRLKELIADQLAEVEATPPPQPPKGGGSIDPKVKEAHEQQLAQAKQQLAQAETLRGEAATAIDALGKALAKPGEDPIPHAQLAETKLAELRKLFFSVIEHLQQLIRDQGETRDQTSAIAGADDFTRAPKLPDLVKREEEHDAIAKAITDALAAQADAAAKGQQQPQAPGGAAPPDAKTLAQAVEEVRKGNAQIVDAKGTLVKARDNKTQSQSLAPALESQAKAIEHLENALRLLQPPQKNNNKQQQQQDQQQQQQQQPQQPQKQDQQSGAGAGQRARDEDARQQKRRQQRDSGTNPVEKDW
jgi:hypothetical protein